MKHTWHSRCRHELPSWCPLWGSLLFPPASASPWSWPRSPLSEERRLPVGLALQACSFYCFLGSPANSCNLSSCSLPFAYLVTGKCHFCFVRLSKDLTHVYSSKWPEVLCSFVAEPFPLLLVQLLFLCQVEHVTPWRNGCGFQPAILLDVVWLFRGRNGMAQKIQVGISSCSLLSGPTSRNITRTLGKLRGYMGFSSNFSLYFLHKACGDCLFSFLF